MEEVLTAKGQLKVIKAAIKELEKDSYSHGKEIARLERKLSIAKIHGNGAKFQLGHARHTFHTSITRF